MPPWASAAITAAPWAAVAIFTVNKVYRLLLAWMVRTGRSDMFVDEGLRHFTVRRGRPDQVVGTTAAKARRLSSVDKPKSEDGPSKRPG